MTSFREKMRPRVQLGFLLSRIGSFIQSLAIMVMKPDDLVEFGRRSYGSAPGLQYWGSEALAARGLNLQERLCLERLPLKSGRLLLLDMGGGRDAIALASLGFTVTGVEFVPELAYRAQENAARQGVRIQTLVQEISRLEVSPASFDVAWLANSMYSSVPTRKRRVAMLRRIHRALQPEGYFFCSFHWEDRSEPSAWGGWARRRMACLTQGNLSYEPGDFLWMNKEFIHAFSSETDLAAEFAAGGFKVVHLETPELTVEGAALLQAMRG